MSITMEEYDGSQDLEQPAVENTDPTALPFPAEKPVVQWEDFLYNERRIALQQRWANLLRFHQAFGCPLDAEGETFAGACVIHGTPASRQELTMDEFMGSYASETREV